MFEKIVGSIGSFSYRNRKLIAVLALVLFAAVFVLQSFLVIEYSYAEESPVTDIFPQDDNLVIVYENGDEPRISAVIEYLAKDGHVTSIQAYANTLGAPMSAAELSEMMGIPLEFVNTLFYIHENGMSADEMTLVEFVNFISSDDFLNNELLSSMIDDETKGQIGQLKTLTDALSSEREYTVQEISDMLGVDVNLVNTIFLIAQLKRSDAASVTPALLAYISNVLGMDAETIEQIFKVQPVKSLGFTEFVDIITELVGYADGIIDEEQKAQLAMLETLSAIVSAGDKMSAADLAQLLSGFAESEMMSESTLSLLFIMASASNTDMTSVRVPLYDFFTFLSEEILANEAFSQFFDESVAAQFEEAKATMHSGLAQLVGEDHSRMVVTIDYAFESDGIYSFYENLDTVLDETLEGEYYLVGMSAMSYEVSESFESEYLTISVVTAVVVFLVVFITFRKFFLSFLLIGVIECAVFSMMSVMVVIHLPMYFIPLILVQCILMGSMIDYAILFTTYYMEVRREYGVAEALPEVMRRATNSILTSSLLIVSVTLICGRLMSGAVASILTTLGIGSFCAILLILFVLPSLLVIFDRFVIKQEGDEVDEFD
jgi:predicted RND superfamily exporter protein